MKSLDIHRHQLNTFLLMNIKNKQVVDPPNELKDYKIEHPKQADKLKRSRNALLIDKNISYKRKKDMENEHTCAI